MPDQNKTPQDMKSSPHQVGLFFLFILSILFCACIPPKDGQRPSSLQKIDQEASLPPTIDQIDFDPQNTQNDASMIALPVSLDQSIDQNLDHTLNEMPDSNRPNPPPNSPLDSNLEEGMTPHLRQWLDNQTDERATQIGLSLPSLARLDLNGGAFGGFVNDTDRSQFTPVIFIHGNSDRALGGELGGWSATTTRLKAAGYRSADVYATTYGPADSAYAFSEAYQHTVENVLRIRLMIELILEYTESEEVNVVAHSLGTTLTRRALLGGIIRDQRHQVDLGPPLTGSIKTFVSLAGAHLGLSSCYFSVSPVCSADLGLYPGQLTAVGIVGQSRILQTLNATSGYEGHHRISIWSPADELIGGRCLVWGQNTCQLPEYTHDYRQSGLSHLEVRDQTVDLQLEILTR